MSRKSNTEQRRLEIIAALMRVMAEHGYEKATIQAIAKAAQLSPGLIHYHFKTKSEILLALIASLLEVFRTRFVHFSAGAQTPHEKLSAYVQARLAKGVGANSEAVAAWVMIGAEAVRQVEVRCMYQGAIAQEMQLLQGLLSECLIARGKTISAVPRLAAAIIALVEGAFQLASAAEDVMPKDYAATVVSDLLERFMDAEVTV